MLEIVAPRFAASSLTAYGAVSLVLLGELGLQGSLSAQGRHACTNSRAKLLMRQSLKIFRPLLETAGAKMALPQSPH